MEITYTHDSYKAAREALEFYKAHNIENRFVTWDAGEGFRGRGYVCAGRIISVTITPDGYEII